MSFLRRCGAIVAVASVLYADNALATTIYHLTGLGFLPSETNSSASAISSNGQVTGYCDSLNSNVPIPFIWTASGGMRQLKIPAGELGALGWGINSSGQVASESYGQQAYLLTTANARSLGNLPGYTYESFARGINDNGQVIGFSYDFSTNALAFIWTPTGGLRSLGQLITGGGSAAFAINSQGEIVGYAGTSLGQHPVVWNVTGTIQDIEPLTTQDRGQADAINSIGDVVGSTDGFGPFIWTATGGTKHIGISPNGINDSDQIVGSNFLNNVGERAAIWTSLGGTQYLTFLMDSSGAGWTLETANAINDAGWIVGDGIDPAGKSEAFLLRPLPEPPSLILFLMAIVVGLFFVRRCQSREPPKLIAKPATRGGAVRQRRLSGPRGVSAVVFLLLTWNGIGRVLAGTNGVWIDAGTGGNWSNPSNWQGGVVADGADGIADFSTLDISSDLVVHLDTARTIGGLTFGDVTPSNGWTLDNNGNAADVLTLSVSSGSPSIGDVNGSAILNAAVAGTQGFVKSGSGTLVLGAANPITGVVTVANGAVELNNTAALATATASVNTDLGLVFGAGISSFSLGGLSGANNLSLVDTAASSIVLTVGGNNGSSTYSGTLSGGGRLIKTGTGTLTLSGSNTFSGGTTIAGGILNINSDAALGVSPVQPTTNIIFSGSTATLQFAADFSATPLNANRSIQVNSGAAATLDTQSFNVTVAGNILGPGGLIKKGTGTLSLAGNNSYLGGTTLSAGTLQLAGGTLGSTTAGLTVNGGVFDLDGTNPTVGFLNGSGGTIANNMSGTTATLIVSNIPGVTSNFSGVIADDTAGTGLVSLVKLGSGTVVLSGLNTYSGGTTVAGGTLTIGGTTAALRNLSPLDIGGLGTFLYQGKSTGSSQSLGTLSLFNSDGTVQSTHGSSGNTSLSFTSVSRSIGATGTFVVSGGTNGSSNKIVVTGAPANALIDPGVFFSTGGARSYAWNDPAGFVRAINYATDPGAMASSGGTSISGTNIQVNGPITAQPTSTFSTLNVTGTNSLTLVDGATLTVSSILKTGSNTATISGGAGIQAPLNGELLIRTDLSSDFLSFNTPIVSNGVNPLTVAGAGVVILSAPNTYTGGTLLDSGELRLVGGGSLGGPSASLATNGGTFNLAGTNQSIGNLTGTAGTILNNVSSTTATLTIGTGDTSSTYGGVLADHTTGSGTLAVLKTGTGTLTLSGANTYTGGTTVAGGSLRASGAGTFGGQADTINMGAGTLDLNGTNQTIGLLNGTTGVIVNNRSGTHVTLNLGNGNSGFSGVYSGVIADNTSGTGTLAVAKAGGGFEMLTGTNTYSGGTTITFGALGITSDSALGAVPATPTQNIVFNGAFGTLLFGAAFDTSPLNANRSIGVASSATGTFNTQSFNVDYGGTISGAGGISKIGSGTLSLSGVSTFTGGAAVNGGTLLLDGDTGAFAPTVPVTVSAGSFVYQGKSTGSAQTLGSLSFSTGDGIVQSTYGTSGNTTLSFTSVSRSAGSTGTFIVSGGTNGSSNKIVVTGAPTNALVDPGVFFSSSSGNAYAWNDSAGFVRAINYATDPGTAASNGGTSIIGANVQVNGPITAQPTSTFSTLNITGNNSLTLADGGTLTVSSIYKTGGSTSTISGGAGLQAPPNSELLVRTDQPSDILSINTSILANGTNPLTIDGAGTLVLGAANTLTGGILVGGGQLQLGNSLAAQNNTIRFANSGSLSFSSSIGTFTVGGLSGFGPLSLTDVSGNPVTLQVGNNGVSTSFFSIGGSGSLVKLGAGTLFLPGANSFSGGVAINAGTLEITSDTSLGTPPPTPTTNITFGGNGTLQFASNLTSPPLNPNRSMFINSGAVATLDTQSFNVVYGGAISGAGSLTKLGTGTLTLTGANSFSGGTTVSGGTLSINSDSALGAVPASPSTNLFFAGLGTLQFTAPTVLDANRSIVIGSAPPGNRSSAAAAFDTQGFDVTIAGNISGPDSIFQNAFLKIGTGTLTLSGTNTFVQPLAINGGVLKLTSPAALGASGFTFGNAGFSGGGGTLQLGFNVSSPGLSLGGTSSSSITLDTNGFLVNLRSIGSGPSQFTVSSSVPGGDAIFQGSFPTLGTLPSVTVTVNSGSALQLNAASTISLLTVNGDLKLNGTNQSANGLEGNGTITNVGVFGSSLSLSTFSNTKHTFSGVISDGTAGQMALVISGNQLFTGPNTYSGGTNITSGAVQLGGVGTLGNPSAGLTIGTGALDLNGTNQIVGALNGGGTITNTAASTLSTLTVGSGGASGGSYSGVISDGAGGTSIVAVMKVGTGSQSLLGANTYSGTSTIDGGTLTVGSLGNIGIASGIGKGSAVGSPSDLVFGGGVLRYVATTAATSTNRLFTIGDGNGSSATLDSSSTTATDTLSFTGSGPLAFGNLGTHLLTLTGSNTGANVFAPALTDQSPSAPTNLVKSGIGTWVLTGSDTLTGGVSITGGILKADGNSAILASTLPVSINGSGGFVYQGKSTGSLQSLGPLAFAVGDGTVQSNYGTSGNTRLSFSSLSRSVGATGTFVASGGTNGTTNVIAVGGVTADSFLDAGTFFGTGSGDNYAWDDAGGFLRAINYSTDLGASTKAGAVTLNGIYVQTTGAVTAQATSTFATLNINAATTAAGAFTLASGTTLTLNGILKTGGGGIANASVIAGGVGLQAAPNKELVIRTDQPTDVLTINAPISADGTNRVTVSGLGLLKFGQRNSYTGGTTIDGGTLQLSGSGTLGDSSGSVTTNGGVLDLNGTTQSVGSLAGIGGTILNNSTGTNATISIGNNNASGIYGGVLADHSSGTGTLSLVKAGNGTETLTASNGYSGGTTINAGVVQLNGPGTLGAATGSLTVNAGGLDLGGTNQTVGSLNGRSGTVLNSASGINPTLTIGSGGATNGTFLGTIVDHTSGSGVVSIAKTGSGIQVISGTNSYTGPTVVDGGILNAGGLADISQPSCLGKGSTGGSPKDLVFGGGTLQFTSLNGPTSTNRLFTVGDLNGTSATIDSSSPIAGNTLSFTNPGALTFPSGSSQTVALTGSNTGPNQFAPRGGFLVKSGSGTWILTGTAQSFGTNVNGGLLQLGPNSVVSGPSSSITVNAGTLDLHGNSLAIGSWTGSGGSIVNNMPGTHVVLTVGAVGTTLGGSYSGVLADGMGTVGLAVSEGGGAFELAGANTFSGGIVLNSGEFDFDSDAALGAVPPNPAQSIVFNSSATMVVNQFLNPVTINSNRLISVSAGAVATLQAQFTAPTFYGGVISGAGGIALKGGLLTLSGPNTYRGGTQVAGGTLRLSGAGTLGDATAGLTMSGGTLDLNGLSQTVGVLVSNQFNNNVITNNVPGTTATLTFGNGSALSATTFCVLADGIGGQGKLAIVKAGSGTETLNGISSYSGGTTIAGGTLSIAGDYALGAVPTTPVTNLVFSSSSTLQFAANFSTSPLMPTRSTAIADGVTATFDSQGFAVSYAGQINGGGALNKIGAGSLTLSGTSTYTGGTTIAAGQIVIGSSTVGAVGGPLGLPSSPVYLGDVGGTSAAGLLVGGADAFANPIVVQAGSSSVATIGGISASNSTISGSITLQKPVTFTQVPGGVLTATGPIGGSNPVTVTGGGTVAFTAANSFSGGTTISGATLNIGSDAALGAVPTVPTTNVSVNGNGTLQFSGDFVAVPLNANRQILVNSGAALTIDTQAFNGLYGGVISGAGKLTKQGSGSLTLSGVNTYSGGTAINGGTLEVDGNTGSLSPSRPMTLTGSTFAYLGSSSGSSLSMGSLSLVAGDSTVQSSFGTSGVTSLAFSGLARSSGATGSFIASGGINGATNEITINGLALNSLVGQGIFFGTGNGDGFAWYDANGFLRAIDYTTDSGATTSAGGTSVNGSFVQTTGPVTAEATNMLTTLNISAATSSQGSFTLANGATLTVNGILKTGGGGLSNSALISGGAGIQAAANAELVIRADQAGDSLIIATPVVANGVTPVTVSGNGLVQFAAPNSYSGGTTINGGMLQLAGAGTLGNMAGGLTVSGGVLDLNGTSQSVGFLAGTSGMILNNASGTTSTLTIGVNNGAGSYAGTIADNTSGSGIVSLIKVGTGTQTLLGTDTFSGTTAINSGVLQLGSANALLNSTVLVNTNNGVAFSAGVGAFTFGGLSGVGNIALVDAANNPITVNVGNNNASTTYAGTLSGSGSVVKSGSGTLLLSGTNSLSGSIAIAAGTLQLGAAAAVQTATINLTPSGSLAFSPAIGSFTVGGLAGDGSVPLVDTANSVVSLQVGNNNLDSVYAGTLSGGGSLVKLGSGKLSLTNGSNSFSGGSTINGGILNIASDGALGPAPSTPAANIIFSGNGTLQLGPGFAGGAINPNRRIIIQPGVNGTLDTQGFNLSYGGLLDGSGTLHKQGSGTLVFTGSALNIGALNAGGISVDDGVLNLGNATAMQYATATVNVNAGLTFAPSGGSVILGALAGSGSIVLADTSGAPITLQVGGNNTDSSYGGNLTGSGSLIKTGSGFFTLYGIDTFSGPTRVMFGTMQLGNSLENSAITVDANATLSFSSGSSPLSIGGLSGVGTVATSGTLQVGNNNATTVFSGTMNGAGSLEKVGTGSLTLAGTNTYSGTTTVSNGVLVTTSQSTLPQGNVVIRAADGAVAQLVLGSNQTISNLSGTISGSGSATLVVNSGTTTTLNQSANSTFGGTLSNAGTFVKAGVGTFEVDNVGVFGSNSALQINGGLMRFAPLSGTPVVATNATATVAAGASLELAGSVSALGAPQGNLVRLTNNSQVAGGGLLVSGTNQQVGAVSGSGTLVIAPAGQLTSGQLQQDSLVIVGSGQLSLRDGPVPSTSTVGTLFGAGSIQLNSNSLTIGDSSNGSSNFFGSISGNGGITKVGTGTLLLGGPNTYHGNTMVSAGRLQFNLSNEIASVGAGATATVAAGAILELAGSASALGTATGDRAHVINNSVTPGIIVTGANQILGGIDGPGTTQVNAGSDLTATHIIQSALIIGGNTNSAGLVTISASDSAGKALAELPLATTMSRPVDESEVQVPVAVGPLSVDATETRANTSPGGVPLDLDNGTITASAAVPEPNTWVMITEVVAGLTGLSVARFHRSGARNSLRIHTLVKTGAPK